jgi:predicted component of type VI protein secretion system
MEVRLVVQIGPSRGKALRLPRGEILVGRRKDCHLRLVDPRVSRTHCRIRFDGLAAVVEDLDSANGTLVNGARVRRATLKDGDLLQVGGIMLAVRSGPVTTTPRKGRREVPDEAVAVMGRPPGGAVSSEEESVAGAMAAMAEDEGEGRETEPAARPIEIDFSPTRVAPIDEGAAAIPVEEDVAELAGEASGESAGPPSDADDDEPPKGVEIRWEPPGEDEPQG